MLKNENNSTNVSKKLRNENKTTFVVSVRIDIRHLAKIASYLNQKGVKLSSKGKAASEGLKVLAENLNIPCETFEDALLILTDLEYENPRGIGTRSEKALKDALNTELKMKENQPDINEAVQEQVRIFNEKNIEVSAPSAEAQKGDFIVGNISPEEAKELTEKEASDVKSLRKAMEGVKI